MRFMELCTDALFGFLEFCTDDLWGVMCLVSWCSVQMIFLWGIMCHGWTWIHKVVDGEVAGGIAYGV